VVDDVVRNEQEFRRPRGKQEVRRLGDQEFLGEQEIRRWLIELE
jgi:hypothetical protein